jgi:hypothetical protein
MPVDELGLPVGDGPAHPSVADDEHLADGRQTALPPKVGEDGVDRGTIGSIGSIVGLRDFDRRHHELRIPVRPHGNGQFGEGLCPEIKQRFAIEVMAAGHDRGRVGVDDPAEGHGVERVVETCLAPRPAQPVSGRSLFEMAAGRQPFHDYRRHPGISEQLSKPHDQEAACVPRRAEPGLGRALSPVHGLVGEDAMADRQDRRDLKVADLENDVGTGREALPAEGLTNASIT